MAGPSGIYGLGPLAGPDMVDGPRIEGSQRAVALVWCSSSFNLGWW